VKKIGGKKAHAKNGRKGSEK
jgi:hypothetical protein